MRANAAESFAEQLEKQLSIENNHIIEMNTKDPAELAKSIEESVQKLKEALHADLEKELRLQSLSFDNKCHLKQLMTLSHLTINATCNS